MRLAKFMASAGLCSRRDAEKWIQDGRVVIDGKKHQDPAINVSSSQVIQVDGKRIKVADEKKLWMCYKPRGVMTTHKDPEGRLTIFQIIQEKYASLPRVISVGRLDFNTEGLLLLTNSGELARHLEHPSSKLERQYRVRVHGSKFDSKIFSSLENGITIQGVKYGPIKADFERQTASNAWVNVTLSEGKNREVRNVMEHFRFEVSRMIRTSYGPFTLPNDMLEGQVKEVNIPKEFIEGMAKRMPENNKADNGFKRVTRTYKGRSVSSLPLGLRRRRPLEAKEASESTEERPLGRYATKLNHATEAAERRRSIAAERPSVAQSSRKFEGRRTPQARTSSFGSNRNEMKSTKRRY